MNKSSYIDNNNIIDNFKIFLSYSTKDKIIAGRIKLAFESLGFSLFLAHNDIEPSKEWIDAIVDNLQKCDIFIPYLTEDSRNSYWVNQEIGMAFILSKIIFPIKLTLNPWGFIGGYQAYTLKIGKDFDKNLEKCCDNLINLLKSDNSKRMLDTLILGLNNSYSYANSNKLSIKVKAFTDFNKNQVNELIRAYKNNDQVNNAFEAKKLMEKLVLYYKSIIDNELLQELNLE